MRALIGVVAIGVAVAPVSAQTKVVTQLQQDTVVRIKSVDLTAAAVRAAMERWVASMRQIGVLQKKLNDTTMQAKARAYIQSGVEQLLWQANTSQRQIVVACSAMRPAGDDIPGTLGIEVDSNTGVQWVLQSGIPGKESLTMMFSALPRVQVVSVGSPAEKAGVQVGDVWIAMNGRPLVGEVRFDELLRPGSFVRLRVARSGREMELPQVQVARKSPVRNAEYPAGVCDSAQQLDAFAPPFEVRIGPPILPKTVEFTPPAPRASMPVDPDRHVFLFMKPATAYHGGPTVYYGGATLEAISDDWRNMLGVQGDGLVAKDLDPGAPAYDAGLRRFDVITQVNGTNVASPAVFQQIADEQATLVLTVVNKGGVRKVTLTRSR